MYFMDKLRKENEIFIINHNRDLRSEIDHQIKHYLVVFITRSNKQSK
jgi:hypothetical protein